MFLNGSDLAGKCGSAAVVALLVFHPLPALADPATHSMVLSAHDVSHDGLTSCLIRAEITNVGDGHSTKFTTRFGFLGHPGIEPGTLAYFRFRWPALAPQASDTETDHVEGMSCTSVEVITITGDGPDAGASFIKIDVASLAAPKVKKQVILVD